MPSFLVYFLVYCILLIGCIYAKKLYKLRRVHPLNNGVLWGCLIIISIIVGSRWMVGVDYPNYLEVIRYGTRSYELDRFEPIPKIIVLLIEWLNLPFYIWFIVFVFFQLLGIVILANRKYTFLIVWIMTFYLTYFFEPSLNIIRQITACIYALCACTYICDKKFGTFALFTIVAIMFHSSAVIILPFYWLARREWFYNRILQYVIIVFCCIIGGKLVTIISDYILQFEELKYVDYLTRDLLIEQGSGIGVILTYVRYAILVFYSKELKVRYSSVGFNVFYNLTFIDMCIYASIVSNQMISRMMLYFTMADIVASSFLIHYLLSKRNDLFSKIIAAIILLIIGAVGLRNACFGEPWQFV